MNEWLPVLCARLPLLIRHASANSLQLGAFARAQTLKLGCPNKSQAGR